jgi:hypothetical protein
MTVQEAFARYSQTLGVTVDSNGALPEVWARLQANVKPASLLSRTLRHVLGVGCLLIALTFVAFILILLGAIIRGLFTR